MRSFLIAIALILSATFAHADEILTPADIEKVSELRGVQFIDINSNSRTDTMNFTDAKGNVFLKVDFMPPDYFDTWKSNMEDSSELVSGIGEAALRNKEDGPLNQISFKKGEYTVALTAMIYKDLKPALSVAQLTELAKLAAERM